MPGTRSRRTRLRGLAVRLAAAVLPLGLLLLRPGPDPAAAADGIPVEIANASEATRCTEVDNVTLTLASPAVRRFRIEATHPAYVGRLAADRRDPDWTDCPEVPAASVAAPAARQVLYEDADVAVVGYAYPGFWRPADVPFRAGGRVERGLTLVQLWVRRDGRPEEVLAVYPGDGYWRIRPLPPEHLGSGAYGSSVLLGPVQAGRRPFVALREIVFDPDTLTFAVLFAGGGSATVRLETLDRRRLALEATLDAPIPNAPFAALRSMHVSEANADLARVSVLGPEGEWREEPVMRFHRATAAGLWAGRVTPSRHNATHPTSGSIASRRWRRAVERRRLVPADVPPHRQSLTKRPARRGAFSQRSPRPGPRKGQGCSWRRCRIPAGSG